MKWTTKQPKVSGYYWLKEPEIRPVATGAWCTPKIVKVRISDYPDYPEPTYSVCNYENDWYFVPGSKWSGLIPPPKD